MPLVTLVSNCVIARASEVNDYYLTARELSVKTAVKRIGAEELKHVFPSYNWGKDKSKGLKLVEGYCVKASTGIFRKKKTVCIEHSSIHYFFQEVV